MSALRALLRQSVSTEKSDHRFGEHACFVAALLLLVLGFVGVGKAAETLADVLVGTLATLSVALQLIILGVVVSLRCRNGTA